MPAWLEEGGAVMEKIVPGGLLKIKMIKIHVNANNLL